MMPKFIKDGMFPNSVGERIRHYRNVKGLTQKEVADKAGLHSSSVVSKYEYGAIIPSNKRLQKIADALDVPIQKLMPVIENKEIEDADRR